MFSGPSLRRFASYVFVGGGTFGLDLLLLYMLTQYGHTPYPLATFLGFFTGISLNYAISRKYVFKGTRRSVHMGYVNMLLAAALGASFTTGLTVLAVQVFGIPYMTARVAVAVKVGMVNYLFNLYLNFRVAGQHA